MPTEVQSEACDVAICGGGLAGLTLALQLRRRLPDASIVVFEKSRRPLPLACFKVGESSVEVGARYFGEVLGLHEHLLRTQLRKNGLRFFTGEPCSPIEERAEAGPPEFPRVPAYQLDRGKLENDLREMCERAGVDLREGVGVRDIELGTNGAAHVVTFVRTRTGEAPSTMNARFVVDATGRRRMLARKLGLMQPITPQASAAWFRVPEVVDVNELVDPSARAWLDRDVDKKRWLSTNHLTGDGRWVWLIPLSNGHTSIGLVAENEFHDFNDYATETAVRDWLEGHEPALAERLVNVPFADFIAMRDYRHGASRVFGKDRWCLVGEAGIFVDPLYSPGSDMIGLGNSITTELVADALEGRGVDEARVDELDAFYRMWAGMLTRTLAGGSNVYGKPEVVAAKLYWDYFYYWAMLCPYFFADLYRLPLAEHRRFSEMLDKWRVLNDRAQRVLQAWRHVAPREPTTRVVGLPHIATTLSDLHLGLLERKDADRTYAEMEANLAVGEELVDELLHRALRRAGPSRARELAARIDLSDWPGPGEGRFDVDAASKRERRKRLSKPLRDMERSIGKSAVEEDAPSLGELWELARS